MKSFRFSICVLALLTAACSKSESPTAPSPTQSGTRIIAIDGSLAYGDVTVGQTKDIALTIRNTGTATLTLNDVTGPSSIASILAISSSSKSVPPGGSVSWTFRLSPAATGAISGTITITGDQTGGTNTTQLTANAVAAPTLPVTVVGVVTDANTRAPVGGVTVSAVKNDATVQSYALTTTDGNGFYSIVVPSATSISVSYSKNGYNFQSSATTFSADTRRDISLAPFWTHSGVGDSVFDMPTNVSRVRVQAVPGTSCQNFIVKIGGRASIINIILGTCSVADARSLDSTYLTGGGGVVSITSSTGVSWTFTQVQ